MAGRLVFSVALEIAIVALEWEMSPVHLLHVFQPRPFGWKCKNTFFALESTACEYVQMSLTFHMVFLHVICNLLQRVWGNFAFSAEKLFSQPEKLSNNKDLLLLKQTWPLCSPRASNEKAVLTAILRDGGTFACGCGMHDEPPWPEWRKISSFEYSDEIFRKLLWIFKLWSNQKT